MPAYSADSLRTLIGSRLPEGSVLPRHTATEHWYYVPEIDKTLPSATGAFRFLREKLFEETSKNKALKYVREKYEYFTPETIEHHLMMAGLVHKNDFEGAGSVGTDIHDARARYFTEWIKTGQRPDDVLAFLDKEKVDIRIEAAMRGLDKFCTETGYIPVVTELPLWSAELGVAGTLDDLGLIGNDLVLLDLKTSAMFLTRYWIQVAIYFMCLVERTGLVPDRLLILKLDKTRPHYSLEEITPVDLVVKATRALVEFDRSYAVIEGLRAPEIPKL